MCVRGGGRERDCVCVCVCVCERERERERESETPVWCRQPVSQRSCRGTACTPPAPPVNFRLSTFDLCHFLPTTFDLCSLPVNFRSLSSFAVNFRLARLSTRAVNLLSLSNLAVVDSGLVGSTDLGGVPREQKMFNGHLPRVIYHQEY